MKKKLLQHLISCTVMSLACAAVLLGTQAPNLPAPGNGGSIPGIEDPENEKDKDEGQKGHPGAEPQDDRDPEFAKGK